MDVGEPLEPANQGSEAVVVQMAEWHQRKSKLDQNDYDYKL